MMSEQPQLHPNNNEMGQVFHFPDQYTELGQGVSQDQIELSLIRLETGDIVEAYFHTPDGVKGMNGLISSFDDSIDLTHTTAGIIETEPSARSTTLKLLLSPAGTDGLQHAHPSLIAPLLQNPAMIRTRELIDRAKHDGAADMLQIYRTLNVLLADITRFRLSQGKFDLEDPQWWDWQDKIHYRHGKPENASYYHPDRLK